MFFAHAHGPIEVRTSETVEVAGQIVVVPVNYVLNPGDDISGQPAEIQQACADWWTAERVAAFHASQESQESGDAD